MKLPSKNLLKICLPLLTLFIMMMIALWMGTKFRTIGGNGSLSMEEIVVIAAFIFLIVMSVVAFAFWTLLKKTGEEKSLHAGEQAMRKDGQVQTPKTSTTSEKKMVWGKRLGWTLGIVLLCLTGWWIVTKLLPSGLNPTGPGLVHINGPQPSCGWEPSLDASTLTSISPLTIKADRDCWIGPIRLPNSWPAKLDWHWEGNATKTSSITFQFEGHQEFWGPWYEGHPPPPDTIGAKVLYVRITKTGQITFSCHECAKT